ncbi:MAG: hypothetical protein WBL40_02645 [Terrimicrobiaceae bacterium]
MNERLAVGDTHERKFPTPLISRTVELMTPRAGSITWFGGRRLSFNPQIEDIDAGDFEALGPLGEIRLRMAQTAK